MKNIDDIETETYSLEVYECECGLHTGFDTTFLEQVGSIEGICPSCKKSFHVQAYFVED